MGPSSDTFEDEEPVRLSDALSPDGILLGIDVMLPGMSGPELAARVRAGSGDTGPAILIISARGEVGDRVEGLEVADEHLAMPFQVRELLARCAALLRRRAALRREPGPRLSRLYRRHGRMLIELFGWMRRGGRMRK